MLEISLLLLGVEGERESFELPEHLGAWRMASSMTSRSATPLRAQYSVRRFRTARLSLGETRPRLTLGTAWS